MSRKRSRAASVAIPVLREARPGRGPLAPSVVAGLVEPDPVCTCPQPVLECDPLSLVWRCVLCSLPRTTDEAMPRRTV